MAHNLHIKIGSLISSFNSDGVRVILDRACMEKSENIEIHNIPLFSDKKSSETELCNVDALIIKDGKVSVIIEIDESKTNPTQICGKYLTSALSNLYQYNHDKIDIPEKTVLFIQIIDTTKFPEPSKKYEKLCVIQQKIEHHTLGIVKKYCLLTDKNYQEVISVINKFLKP